MRHWLPFTRWAPAAIGIAFGCVLGLLLALNSPEIAQGQGGLQLEKRLLKNTNVVTVGETLTFAITITNNWDTTVITLPLIDDYDQSVLRFVDATIPQDTHIAATGVISWNNLLATTGPLAVGQQIVVLLRFIAEHPTRDLRVVNYAETHDAYDSLGREVGDGSGSQNGEAVGGQTPITKTLDMSNGPPQAGFPITFYLTISNNGLVDVVSLPVRDDYDPAALEFISAVPPASLTRDGTIIWDNALQPPLPSRLAPGETVTITVVFRPLQMTLVSVNRAEVMGAEDEFGNGLDPASDDAPILIAPGPTATRTPGLANTPVSDTPVPDTPTPAPVAEVPGGEQPGEASATPTQAAGVVATPTPALPASLPVTADGGGAGLAPVALLLGLALLAAGMFWRRSQRT